MSTILDALRKIEGERHEQSGKARARILVSLPRPLSPAPPYRSRLWTAGVSFLLTGFIVGVWMTRQEESPPQEPLISENYGESAQTLAAVTEGQIQAESPHLRDSPFVSSPQVAPRPSLVDATPQRFSETGREPADRTAQRREDHAVSIAEPAGEGMETPQQPLVPGEPADRTGPDEPEEVYDPAPANSAISFLQWSPEPARRKALVRVGGSPLALVREGDAVGDYTVVEIRPNAVALRSGATRFQLRVR